MTRGSEIALTGDTGGDVTSPRGVSSPENCGAGGLPCKPAPTFSGYGSTSRFVRDNMAQIAMLRREGMTFKVIARHLGVPSYHALRLAWLRCEGYAPRRRLSDMRAETMAMKAQGMTWRQIGEALNVNWNSLHVIAVKHGWTRRA